jgi:hypothetical protein
MSDRFWKCWSCNYSPAMSDLSLSTKQLQCKQINLMISLGRSSSLFAALALRYARYL